jgi:hypothetical protein
VAELAVDAPIAAFVPAQGVVPAAERRSEREKRFALDLGRIDIHRQPLAKTQYAAVQDVLVSIVAEWPHPRRARDRRRRAQIGDLGLAQAEARHSPPSLVARPLSRSLFNLSPTVFALLRVISAFAPP